MQDNLLNIRRYKMIDTVKKYIKSAIAVAIAVGVTVGAYIDQILPYLQSLAKIVD